MGVEQEHDSRSATTRDAQPNRDDEPDAPERGARMKRLAKARPTPRPLTRTFGAVARTWRPYARSHPNEPLRFAPAGSRGVIAWLRTNTFSPAWLPASLRQPVIGYLTSTLASLVAIQLTLWFVQAFPGFNFPGIFAFLAVVLVALSFGAGPSLLATLLGALGIDFFILPPRLSLAITEPSDVIGILLFALVGVFISAIASQTERARHDAEAARLRSERLAREVVERANELEATFDAIGDAVIVFAGAGYRSRTNAAARRLFGMEEQTPDAQQPMVELRALMNLRDERGNAIPEHAWPLTRILRGEEVSGAHAEDLIVRTLDGRDIQLNVSGAPVRDADGAIIGAVCVCRDVTERRRLERRTHEALGALITMAQTLVQAPEGSEADANDPAPLMAKRMAALVCDVLACTRVGILTVEPETQRLHPLAVVGLAPEQERQWWAEQEAQAARLGEGVNAETHARFVAGHALVLDMTQPPYDTLPNPYGITTSLIAPMRVGDSVVGVLSLDYGGARHLFTDDEIALGEAVAQLATLVIERERLLRERAEAQASVLTLERVNAEKDAFLGIVSHELRTPITVLKASVQLLERRKARDPVEALEPAPSAALAPERRVRVFERMGGQVERLNRLVDDLLDVSRIQSGKLELRLQPCDLAQLAREAVEEQRQARPERAIHFVEQDAPLPVMADPDRIGQVVTNYLTNALKYSPEEQPVEVRVRRDGARGYLGVRDHGPGLPPDELARIWERFHRAPGIEVASGSGVGLGLGLYISKTIIERHAGEVGVESAPGEGATFWFALPLAEEA